MAGTSPGIPEAGASPGGASPEGAPTPRLFSNWFALAGVLTPVLQKEESFLTDDQERELLAALKQGIDPALLVEGHSVGIWSELNEAQREAALTAARAAREPQPGAVRRSPPLDLGAGLQKLHKKLSSLSIGQSPAPPSTGTDGQPSPLVMPELVSALNEIFDRPETRPATAQAAQLLALVRAAEITYQPAQDSLEKAVDLLTPQQIQRLSTAIPKPGTQASPAAASSPGGPPSNPLQELGLLLSQRTGEPAPTPMPPGKPPAGAGTDSSPGAGAPTP